MLSTMENNYDYGYYITVIKQARFENFSNFLPIVHMKISSLASDLAPKLQSSYMFSNC